jgi:UTP:GlnB (protein PII) uridylyltransferase
MAVRIWLPDQPGALAQVAGRIAGIGGDVVAIEILQRVNGVVLDEIVVELPRDVTTCRLTRQLGRGRPTEGGERPAGGGPA